MMIGKSICRSLLSHPVQILALCVVVLGCGGGASTPKPKDAVPVYPASGFVTYKGASVEGAVVRLTTPDGKQGASAVTDKDGKFSLMTYQAGDGAPEGEFLVTVTKTEASAVNIGSGNVGEDNYVPPPETPDGVVKPPRSILPKRFSNPLDSKLKATISKSGPNELKFELVD